MSELVSYFQITCVNCESKGKTTVIKTRTRETICHECGAILVIDHWQIKHTLMPNGILIDNSVVVAAAPPDAARKAK